MPRETDKEFEIMFFEYWDNHSLDFDRLEKYLNNFKAKLKAEKKTNDAQVSNLQNYLDEIKDKVSDEDQREFIFTNFKDLLKGGCFITEFLDEYGYEHIDDPEIKALNEFYNKLQVLSMKHGALSEYSYYAQHDGRINNADADESKLLEDMSKFYHDVGHDKIGINHMIETYDENKTRIKELQTEINNLAVKLNQLQTIDAEIQDLESKLDNYDGLKNAKEKIDSITKYYNGLKGKGKLSEDDERIDALFEKQTNLRNDIESAKYSIKEIEDMESKCRENNIDPHEMKRAMDLYNKGVRSEILEKRIQGLSDAYKILLGIKITLNEIKMSLKDGKEHPNIKPSYENAKKYFIENYRYKGATLEDMKGLFKQMEKADGLNSLSLLLDVKMEDYFKYMQDLEEDKKQLKQYEDIKGHIDYDWMTFPYYDHYKDTVKKDEMAIIDCQNEIDKIQQRNYESREQLLNEIGFAYEDSELLRQMSHAKFVHVVNDCKEIAEKEYDKIIKSQGYQDLKKQLDDKKISKQQAWNLSKQRGIAQHDLQSIQNEQKKIVGHVEKARALQARVDNICEARDEVHQGLQDRLKPNRFALLEKSLLDIKTRFGKIQKGSKNSSEFEAMYTHLDSAIAAVQTGDIDETKKALETLEAKTIAYEDAKNRQTRLFPTTLRKWRLQVNNELRNICANRQLIGEDVHERKDLIDNFQKNYKPGNNKTFGDELMNKAWEEYDRHRTKYMRKTDWTKVEKEILKKQQELTIQ